MLGIVGLVIYLLSSGSGDGSGGGAPSTSTSTSAPSKSSQQRAPLEQRALGVVELALAPQLVVRAQPDAQLVDAAHHVELAASSAADQLVEPLVDLEFELELVQRGGGPAAAVDVVLARRSGG